MKATDKAYIAGIIDGEGCLSISNPRPRDGCSEHVLRVGMCDKETILFLKETTGIGSIHKPRKLPSGKLFWTWVVSIHPASRLLKKLLPYLRSKKKQAEIFIKASSVSGKHREKYVKILKKLKEKYGH